MENWKSWLAAVGVIGGAGAWLYKVLGEKAATEYVGKLETKIDVLSTATGTIKVDLARHDERLKNIDHSLVTAHAKLDKIIHNGNGHHTGKLKTRKTDKKKK